MKPIYKQLAKWYAYNEDARNTLLYSDSLQYLSDQLHIEFDETSGFEADKLVRLNANELERLQKQKEQETSKRVMLFFVISIVFIMVIVVFVLIFVIMVILVIAVIVVVVVGGDDDGYILVTFFNMYL